MEDKGVRFKIRRALRWFWWQVKYLFALVFSRKLVAKCGHNTRIKDKVSAFGDYVLTELPVNDDGSVDYCHKCIEKMAIQCAWCGKPIFIGARITLYSPTAKYQVPEYAVTYNHDPSFRLVLVGCVRSTCTDFGSFDASGVWAPPGEVQRIPRAEELLLASGAKAAIVSGDSVILVK